MYRALSTALLLPLLALAAATGCIIVEPEPDPPPAPDCTLSLIGDGLSDVEGGWVLGAPVGRPVTLGVETTRGAVLEPPEVAAGIQLTVGDLDDEGVGTLTLWLAYDAPAEAELSLAARCPSVRDTPEREAGALLTVEPRRPLWTAQPAWTPGENGPPGREYFSFWRAFDDEDTAYVFGGFHYEPAQFTIANDLWSYDLDSGAWTELVATGAPLQAGGGFALGPAGGGLYYGGLAEDGDGGFSIPFAMHLVLPSDPDEVFSPLQPSGAPATASYQPALFFDAPRERFVTVGGQDPFGTHLDVAAYDPDANTWASVDVGGLDDPDGRTGFFWAYDAPTERLIVFSGERGGGAGGTCNCAQDTWALELGEDPPRWSLIDDGTGGPPGRRNGAYALDPLGHRLLVWGGTSDGANTQPGLWALRLDRGKERWDEVLTDSDGDGPAIRSSGGMIYDEARDRMLVGFGNDSIVGARNDLWSLSF